MIDITSESGPKTRFPTLVIVVLLAAYWFWVGRSEPTPTPVLPKLQGVVFVTCAEASTRQEIISSSQVIDSILDGLSVDRRTVLAGSEPEEEWLEEALVIGSGQCPCVVFCRADGSFDAVPTPESIEEMKALIRERTNGL